jgi:hypothetical protein
LSKSTDGQLLKELHRERMARRERNGERIGVGEEGIGRNREDRRLVVEEGRRPEEGIGRKREERRVAVEEEGRRPEERRGDERQREEERTDELKKLREEVARLRRDVRGGRKKNQGSNTMYSIEC